MYNSSGQNSPWTNSDRNLTSDIEMDATRSTYPRDVWESGNGWLRKKVDLGIHPDTSHSG